MAAVAVALAACGSAGDGATTEPSPPTAPPASATDDRTAAAATPRETSSTAPPTTPTTTPTTTSTPTTSVAPTTTSTTAPDDGCRRLDDFDGDGVSWLIVNDGVMGGRSQGDGVIDDSVLRFFGTVVTAGGGFTSVRTVLDGSELTDTTSIRARVRLDDRTYGIRLEDDQEFRGRRVSHGADIPTADQLSPDADGYAIVEVGYDDLSPSVFGQPVTAEPFDPTAATEFGLIIADGIDGDFTIDIDWIDACP